MQSEPGFSVSTREGYDLWSEFYDGDDIPLNLLEERTVDKDLGDIRGLTILDLGCGTGRQTFRLAARGANVTGVDQSEGMLSIARKKNTDERVKLLSHNFDEPLPFADHSFDRVVSFLALEHISDLRAFFTECRRLCKSDGFLYFTTLHPAMLLKGVQARFTDPKTGEKVYPKSFPYLTSDFVNAAITAGLRLEKLGEFACDKKDGVLSERAQKYEGYPLLLTLKFS